MRFTVISFVLSLASASCYGLRAQDEAALIRASKESAAAYCKLDGGGARALIRADHNDVLTVLWHNGEFDGGLPDAGNIECEVPR